MNLFFGHTSYGHNPILTFSDASILEMLTRGSDLVCKPKLRNRNVVGTGLEAIEGNTRTDVRVQMRWTF